MEIGRERRKRGGREERGEGEKVKREEIANLHGIWLENAT